jgi:hypothetical protein
MIGSGVNLDPETLKKQVLGGGNDPGQKSPTPDVKEQIKGLLPGFGK